jgi:hypothetical protein
LSADYTVVTGNAYELVERPRQDSLASDSKNLPTLGILVNSILTNCETVGYFWGPEVEPFWGILTPGVAQTGRTGGRRVVERVGASARHSYYLQHEEHE